MKEKKVLLLFLFSGLVLSNSFFSLVSAYGGGFFDARQGMEDLINLVVDFFQPLLQVLLGGDDWSGYLLFEKLILFIILIGMVFLSLKKVKIFEDNKAVLWIVALAVPLLGIRFLDLVWLNTILVQYQVLAIALTAALPFIIYFLFIYNVLADYDALRKIAWVFFGVVFLGLWSTSNEYNYGYIYLWTAGLAFFFFLFDGTIRRLLVKQQMKALGFNQREDLAREINRQIQLANKDMANNIITAEQQKRIVKRLQRQLEAIYKN